jgi:hypothetical protein
MALVKCSECGERKSSRATFCPHCGYDEHYHDREDALFAQLEMREAQEEEFRRRRRQSQPQDDSALNVIFLGCFMLIFVPFLALGGGPFLLAFLAWVVS